MDSNTSNKVTWAATIAVGVPMFYAGLVELIRWEYAIQLFAGWGFPTGVMVLVGVIQIVGTILLLNRFTASFGAGVLAVIMIGAIATLLANGSTLWAIITMAFLGLLLFIGWERSRTRAYWIETHPHHERHA